MPRTARGAATTGVFALLVAVAILLFAGATAAWANVYCVNFPSPPGDCTDTGYNADQLQTALGDANVHAGADTVRIAPGSYDDAPYLYSGTTPVSIEGSGQGQTTLTITLAPATPQSVLTVVGGGSTVSDLTVEIPAPPDPSPVNRGLFIGASTVSNVSVVGPAANNAIGVSMSGGGTFQSGTVDLQVGAPDGTRAFFSEGNNTIQDTTIQSTVGVQHSNAAATTTMLRSTIKAKTRGVEADSGSVHVGSTIIDLGNFSNAIGLNAANPNPGGDTAITIDADHVTIAGGGTSSIGARALANDGPAADTTTLTLENSIISGPAAPLSRQADEGDTANITTSYSNYPTTGIVDTNDATPGGATGLGAITAVNHTDLAPGFLSPGAGDYHLAAGSALIDLGDPAAPAGADTTDVDGDARPVDGNGDAAARRDIGADEFVLPSPPSPPSLPPEPEPEAGDTSAPETTITNKPKDKTQKKTATFEFTSSEPGSTFECQLDGKETFKACSSPTAVKVKKGKHDFLVRATDPAGNADPTPARDAWKVKRKR